MRFLKKIGKGGKQGQWKEGENGGVGGKVGRVCQLLSESPFEGTDGSNIQVFEGSVAVGISGQSGYWQPKRIISLSKFPIYSWECGRILCGKPQTAHDKVAQFQHKTGVTSAGFLAVFPLPSYFEPL